MKTTSQRIRRRRKTAPRADAHRPAERITPLRMLRKVVVIGLDEVGLDLAFHFALSGIDVVGIDPSSNKVRAIQTGGFGGHKVPKERFTVSDDFDAVGQAETVVLCVPVVDTAGERNDSSLLQTAEGVARHLRRGSLLVAETISERDPICAELRSVLERVSGLKDKRDFTLSFAPASDEPSDAAARVAAIAFLHNLKSSGSVWFEPEVDSTNRAPLQTAKPPRVVPRRQMDRDLADALVNTALICDILVIVYGLLCGFWLRFETGIREIGIPSNVSLKDYAVYIVFGVGSLVLALCYHQVYDTRSLLRIRQVNARVLRAGVTWLVIFVSLPLLFEFEPPISRLFALIAAVTTIGGLIIWRSCFHMYLRKSSVLARLQQRVLFVGWNDDSCRLADTFFADRYSAHVVTGFVQTPTSTREKINERLARCLGNGIEDISSILDREGVDTVILADCEIPQREILRLAAICEQELVAFKIIPSYFRILVSGLQLETMSGTPILGVSRLPLDRFYNALLKRLFDIVGAAAGLVLSVPFVVGCGLMVYWESPGPIFFSQERIGRKGRHFKMHKLRSMCPDAVTSDHVWQSTTRDDPRLLRVGAFMRRWNLDELPQFWNVLKGEMSLVGPRPERTYHSEKLKEVIPHYNSRYIAKPGVTGWAQVNGFRGDTDLFERIKCDLFYLENWSFLLDFQIMLLTFFRNKNAC
jgi:exopolysaccharide biosynthesis polyprenyl glycosylphosphotransferase